MKRCLSPKPYLRASFLNTYQYFVRLIVAVFASLFLTFSAVNAQRWEFGGWVGIANYFGDLNTNTSFEYLGPSGGALMRYNWNKRWAYKIGLGAGKVGYEDVASRYPYQKARNLSFKSNIFELSNEIEFNFFRYEKERPEYSFTPYMTVGFSVFYFNPKAELEGKNYNLRDLGTEGQKNPDGSSKPYSRINFAIIAGGGFKYSFHPRWTLGLEVGVRRTFTDYLDDVSKVYPAYFNNGDGTSADARNLSDRSGEIGEVMGTPGKQRGNAGKKDFYMFSGISITYTILKERCPHPSKVVE
jgi:hypothetical protein